MSLLPSLAFAMFCVLWPDARRRISRLIQLSRFGETTREVADDRHDTRRRSGDLAHPEIG